MSRRVEPGDLFLFRDGHENTVWVAIEKDKNFGWILRQLDDLTEQAWETESNLLHHRCWKRLE